MRTSKAIIIVWISLCCLLVSCSSQHELLPPMVMKQTKASDRYDVTAVLYESFVEEQSVRQDTTLIAENKQYQLLLHESSGNIEIVDRTRTNRWSGIPEMEDAVQGSMRAQREAPFYFRYASNSGSITESYPARESGTVTVGMVQDGVALSYYFSSIEIGFSIIYTLTEDGFEVHIPYEAIDDSGSNKLVGIEPLPNFDAGLSTETGAIFYPDGSGAIMTFKEQGGSYLERYRQPIYGPDLTLSSKTHQQLLENPQENISLRHREAISLPVFGLYREGRGYAAIVTEGEQDAYIIASPKGFRNMNYYRASAEFIYRNEDIMYLGRRSSGAIPLTQGELITGDRTIVYKLLHDQQADYTGIANVYRQYLIDDQYLQPISQPTIPFQLSLFGGVHKEEALGQSFVAMTSFDQARTVMEALQQQGITNLEVTLDGWSNGGKYGAQPVHFPINRKLGGQKGLTALAEYSKQAGIPLYLHTNYVMPLVKQTASKTNKESVRSLNKEITYLTRHYQDTLQQSTIRFSYLNAETAVMKYFAKELPQYKPLQVAGLQMDYIGNSLYSDQNKRKNISKSESLAYWQHMLHVGRSAIGKVSVDYGMAYTFGYVDRITNIPLHSSGYIYEDYAIPFYQMVVHGFIPYSAQASNLSDDPQRLKLKLLEYGAVPSYLFTYEDSSKLKDTIADELFSTQYQDWIEQAVEQYEEIAHILLPLAAETIVQHQQLKPHLFRTIYSDGTTITVNYSNDTNWINSQSIDPLSYIVAKEGNK